MDNTSILCRLDRKTIELWENFQKPENALHAETRPEEMIRIFYESLAELDSPLYLSLEKDSELILAAASKFGKFSVIPFAHELRALKDLFADPECGSVFYVDSIFPLLDTSLVERLSGIQTDYQPDYGFIENTPPGICGVFFGRSLFDAMVMEKNENTTSMEIDSSIPDSMDTTLSSYIEKNINQFHVEIDFAHPDLRLLRLDFSCRSPRSLVQTARFFAKLPDHKNSYRDLQDIIGKDSGILHSFPSYLEIEINGSCEYNCTFCARTFGTVLADQRLETGDIAKLLDQTSRSSGGLGDTVVGLGGLGEPLEHPEIQEILTMILGNSQTPMAILETNGKYLEKLIPLIENPDFGKLRVIVNINSLGQYETIHGTSSENKARVLSNLETFSKAVSAKNKNLAKNIFIQTLKITENETELDQIYDLADTLGISFLLQKYNSYINKMPEKRVSDMTPLERSFCWHLRRDVYIRANGDIAFCKQDVQGLSIRGNIRKNSLDEIRNGLKKDWVKNYAATYPAKPDCAGCDEYYTFNM